MIESWQHIDWEAFHFLRPALLWLFVPLVLFYGIGLLLLKDRVKWKKVIAPHLRPFVIQKGSERMKVVLQTLYFICVSSAIIAVSGPSWRLQEVPEKVLETPLVILLDLSQSMLATDINPTRLDRAKFKIMDLLEADPKARTALVGFAGTAHTIVPLSKDYSIIKAHLEGLRPDILPIPGSNLEDALKNAHSITNSVEAPSTIVLLSDDFTEQSFNELQKFSTTHKTTIEILALNTSQGASIPNPRGSGFVKDANGKTIHSSLNSTVIAQIESLENVNVTPLTLDNSDVTRIADRVSSNLVFKQKDDSFKEVWQDEGYILILPFAVFLLFWFRKGWVLYLFIIQLSVSSCSDNQTFNDLWYTKDYQAQKLYNASDYENAASTFTQPMYQGVAYYKAGEYDKAIEAFAKDPSANGLYNLGMAHYKNGDYTAAEIAFNKAIEADPSLEQAAKNSAQMEQLINAQNETSLDDAQEAGEQGPAKNKQNSGPEDLSGGGQEATKEDMQKERQEETVSTDIRKGKELDEVPDDFETEKTDNSQKVLMRKVDDDPALFLKRKFKYQVKKDSLMPKKNSVSW